MDTEPCQETGQSEKFETLGRMVRLTWKTLGSMLLFLLLVLIIIGSQFAVTILHVVFWIAVAGLISARYIDIKVFRGQTDDNEPATLKDWLRYSIGLIMASGFFWLLALVMRNKLH